MKRARIEHLHVAAKERQPGYLEACRREGILSPDGLWIHFTDETHARLRQQYHPAPPTVALSPPEGAGVRGLGDLVHKVAGPIGRAVRWPCMKGDGTTELKSGSPCDRARHALNVLHV